ncbi:MAG: NAD(P)-dependent oxidoreductase [Burkholderiaceae bacterium]
MNNTSPSRVRIGFIGLGVMGAPMVGHLAQAGYSVTAFDIAAGRMKVVSDAHVAITFAANAAELAEQSDVIFTMLPDGKHVEQALLSTDGARQGLKRGSIVVDTSSSEPEITRATAQALLAYQVDMVDAPTSGAQWGAEAAELVFMVGGPADVVARIEPLLRVMGRQVFHLGPTGAGHAMKSINNLITANTFLATAEGLALGKSLGLNPAVMTDVINECTAMSWISQTHIRQRILNRAFDDPFKLALMTKDMRIALEQAKDKSVPMPLSSQGFEQYQQANAFAGDSASVSELFRWVEHKTGVTIAAPESDETEGINEATKPRNERE